MDDMIAKYFKELRDIETVVMPDYSGFYMYYKQPTSIFISQIYLKPEARGWGYKKMIDSMLELCANLGVYSVMTSVELGNKDMERTLAMHLRHGFKIVKLGSDIIYLQKGVK